MDQNRRNVNLNKFETKREQSDGRTTENKCIGLLLGSLHMTQAGLAELMGIARQTVGYWVRGERQPKNSSIRQIASIAWDHRDLTHQNHTKDGNESSDDYFLILDPQQEVLSKGHGILLTEEDVVTFIHTGRDRWSAEEPQNNPQVNINDIMADIQMNEKDLQKSGLTGEQLLEIYSVLLEVPDDELKKIKDLKRYHAYMTDIIRQSTANYLKYSENARSSKGTGSEKEGDADADYQKS